MTNNEYITTTHRVPDTVPLGWFDELYASFGKDRYTLSGHIAALFHHDHIKNLDYDQMAQWASWVNNKTIEERLTPADSFLGRDNALILLTWLTSATYVPVANGAVLLDILLTRTGHAIFFFKNTQGHY